MKKLFYPLLCFICLHANAQYANGKIKVYFDSSVDNAAMANYPAINLTGIWADTLAAYIDRAKTSVDVACYDFTQGESGATQINIIATAINSAYSRGVTVRWIYNGSSSNTGLTLLNSGIKTLGSPTSSGYGIMHNKFVIIDAGSTNPDVPIVWTGSPDWSQWMLDSDYNNIIIFQDSALAQAYTAQFNQMWGGTGASPVAASEKFGTHKTDLGPHTFTIGGSEVELYFSPTDATDTHIQSTINSAIKQVYVGMYTFTMSDDATAMINQKNAGLDVKAVISSYSATAGSAFGTLSTALGTNLKEYMEANDYVFHNKYLITDPCYTSDDPKVLTGSHNWTSSANTENDENTVIVHNADVANLYYQAFVESFNTIGTSNQMTPCATVTNPCANSISAAASVNTNVLCAGQNTGSATVHAHGIHGPYTYSWSSSPVQTDSVLSNVAGGTYSVTVTDASSCTATASVTISAPTAALNVSVTATALTCNGAGNGSATAAATGGTGAYSYKWSSSPQQTTVTASNLSANTYSVTVSDANSCTATGSATVSQPSAISINASVTDVACLNGTNGSIAATVTGGTGTLQYLWSTSPQQTTATASGLTSGSYTVTVTDAHNCTASSTFNVTQPNSGITLSTSTTNTGCNTSTGTATVSIVTGTGPFQYTWSTSPQQTTAEAAALAAGNYTVTVSVSGGCSATASALVNSSGGPSIVANSGNTTCGSSNGTASVSASGGNPPYSYSWSNGASTASISNLASGTFTVTVHDNSNCASIATVTVTASNGLVLNTSSTATSCGGNNGSATVTVSNGTNPVYSWNNGGTTATISNLAANTYSVTVTDGGTCSASASVTVSGGSGTTSFNITADRTTVCYGDSANLCAITGYTTYQWSNNASGACIYVNQTATYTVTASDNGGCSATSTPIAITVDPQFSINFAATADTLIATAATSYQWLLGGDSIVGATTESWVATQSGNYSVAGTDAAGCNATSSQKFISVEGIQNISNSNFVKVYPNPLQGGNWQLEVSSDWIGSAIEIFDATGKAAYKSEVRNLKSELSVNLAQGVYLIKISGNGKSVVQKLIKL